MDSHGPGRQGWGDPAGWAPGGWVQCLLEGLGSRLALALGGLGWAWWLLRVLLLPPLLLLLAPRLLALVLLPLVGISQNNDMALKIGEAGQSLCVDLSKFFFSGDPTETGLANDARCFPMEFGGQMLVVIKGQHFFRVLRFEVESSKLLHVKSISNHAIFIAQHRCLAVDADMFSSIEANCIYYTEHHHSSAHILKYNQKAERVSEAVDFVKHKKQFVLMGERPFTIVQLLSSYTISIQDSELALQQTI